MLEIITLVTNLGALTVIGFIYVAYIQNLRSTNELKEAQLKVAEQNVKLWKDKHSDLERKSPEFVEKLLSDRISIREEELKKLSEDSDFYAANVEQKTKEIDSLKDALFKALEFKDSYTVWDQEKSDFIQVDHSDLEFQNLGSFSVDSANFMICDPFYLKMQSDRELSEFTPQEGMYQVIETGEVFCTNHPDDAYCLELLGLDSDMTINEMLEAGLLKNRGKPKSLPAIPHTYIRNYVKSLSKDELNNISPYGGKYQQYRKVTPLSFLNGLPGAGISISLPGDGIYQVCAEKYQGSIKRIIIEV